MSKEVYIYTFHCDGEISNTVEKEKRGHKLDKTGGWIDRLVRLVVVVDSCPALPLILLTNCISIIYKIVYFLCKKENI